MEKKLICDGRSPIPAALAALYRANWGPAGNRAVYGLQQKLRAVQEEWQAVVKKILEAHKDGDGLTPDGMREYDTLVNTMGGEQVEIEKIKLMRGTAFDNISVTEMNILDLFVDWQ